MNTKMPRPMLWLRATLLLGGTLLLAACVGQPFPVMLGTRDVVTRELDYRDFDEVAISDAFTVQIRQGDEFRVVVEMDEATLDYLDVSQSGSRLNLGLRPRQGIFWNMDTVHRAEITMPSLVAVEAHDAARVTVNGFATDAAARFEATDASWLEGEIASGDAHITARDASHITLEGDRNDVEIDLNGASDVTLVGAGRNLSVRAANASRANLADFSVQDADVRAQDASNIIVEVAGKLDAEADDASNIEYYGDPTLGTIESSDGSTIRAHAN